MGDYVIQQTQGVFYDDQLATSTSAALVNTATSFPTQANKASLQGVILTNNDASISMYLGFNSSVTSTRFFKILAPGESYERLMSRADFDKLYVIAASGNPNLNVVAYN